VMFWCQTGGFADQNFVVHNLLNTIAFSLEFRKVPLRKRTKAEDTKVLTYKIK